MDVNQYPLSATSTEDTTMTAESFRLGGFLRPHNVLIQENVLFVQGRIVFRGLVLAIRKAIIRTFPIMSVVVAR